ncbi:hypothetical protein NDU88_006297 [Pleurodeles waltl]|uniref:Uncharacterized protein n=1 Tax=Pleurodeles waltl TaxID=8319 RepID=A0AAV7VMD4_PLEWA|nr:hypothetical protein NDU88_006297 [Pleurodeles waltl]
MQMDSICGEEQQSRSWHRAGCPTQAWCVPLVGRIARGCRPHWDCGGPPGEEGRSGGSLNSLSLAEETLWQRDDCGCGELPDPWKGHPRRRGYRTGDI